MDCGAGVLGCRDFGQGVGALEGGCDISDYHSGIFIAAFFIVLRGFRWW